MIRTTVHFSGQVQGVGFRYTAVEIAQRYAVSGYVQNLADRRVRLVAEGLPDQTQGLINEIRERMGQWIADWGVLDSPATGEFGPPRYGALTIKH